MNFSAFLPSYFSGVGLSLSLIAAIGAQRVGTAKGFFVGGAASGSVLWLVGLGYGARWLAPWFARPGAWQMLDGLIGLTMLGLAAMLLRQAMV